MVYSLVKILLNNGLRNIKFIVVIMWKLIIRE